MSRLTAALALIASLYPAFTYAQVPGQGPPFPMGMDLKKVPIGSWADYTVNVAKMPPMKTRMALVARVAATSTIEMAAEGGMALKPGAKLVAQSEVETDASKDARMKLMMQMGENDPMLMPMTGSEQKQFLKPNPKSLVKEETIIVPAGTFKTKHYRDKTPKGDAFQFWISDKAPPFGVVKMEAEVGGGLALGTMTFELTALGKGAKAAITKPAKPFDQAAFMGQIMGSAQGQGGGPPAGGPVAPGTKK